MKVVLSGCHIIKQFTERVVFSLGPNWCQLIFIFNAHTVTQSSELDSVPVHCLPSSRRRFFLVGITARDKLTKLKNPRWHSLSRSGSVAGEQNILQIISKAPTNSFDTCACRAEWRTNLLKNSATIRQCFCTWFNSDPAGFVGFTKLQTNIKTVRWRATYLISCNVG